MLARTSAEVPVLIVCYAAALFVSAALLFLLEPMIGKMLLPLLGGAPAVWTTCVLFFQFVLLLGALYAHVSSRWLAPRWRAMIHGVVLLAPLAVLPIHLSYTQQASSSPESTTPISWLLVLLTVSVGLPFFALSTSGPVLQRWFARSEHPTARDPYALYSASNLGSLVALVAYPWLIEPRLLLVQQRRMWAIGYGLYVALVLTCAVLSWRGAATPAPAGGQSPRRGAPSAPGQLISCELTAARRLRWVALSACPASLMLGVTTYLSTDIAAIPLLWVVPLALYLLTFALVFSPIFGRIFSHRRIALTRLLPLLVLALLFVMFFSQFFTRLWHVIPLHLLVFFVAALCCHGELAADRPAPRHLTEYYLWLSLGGVLGGLFNGLLAPVVWSAIIEYPVALIASCLLMQHLPAAAGGTSQRGLLAPLLLGALAAVLIVTSPWVPLAHATGAIVIYGAPLLLGCYLLLARAVRSRVGLVLILLLDLFIGEVYERVLYRERSFFGTLRVLDDRKQNAHRLMHGTTLHGFQSLDPARRGEPLMYYHRAGPIGQVFTAFSGPARKEHVALIGLGTGALSTYGEPGQRMTYYEIDPAVVRIARDPCFFTFLRDSKARVEIVLGDARLRLATARSGSYGMIVIDAFSSDAVPTHLLTTEALRIYRDKLAAHGVLVFHISNRYFRLESVLGDLARSAGMVALSRNDDVLTEAQRAAGALPSHWVVLANGVGDLGPLAKDARWRCLAGPGPLEPGPSRGSSRGPWTDDFSDLLGVMR